MSEKARRKDLQIQYRQSGPEAGVYRIVNTRSGRALIGSSSNLGSVRGKLEFARATRSPSVLDHRLQADAREVGLEALSLEILEVLETKPDQTPTQVRADLDALEALWRERLASTELY